MYKRDFYKNFSKDLEKETRKDKRIAWLAIFKPDQDKEIVVPDVKTKGVQYGRQ